MIEAIAWPIVALILGLVAIFVFRSPLVRKIDRISRAGTDGITFEHAQADSQATASKPPIGGMSFEDLMKHPVSSAVLDRERFITARLKEMTLKADSERLAVLTRALASVGMDLDFTKLSHGIFGSQLALLVQLAGTRAGLDLSQVEAQFEAAKAQYAELYAQRTFEDWLAYLLNNNLVRKIERVIDLTQHGSDFLKFLVDARQAHTRYG